MLGSEEQKAENDKLAAGYEKKLAEAEDAENKAKATASRKFDPYMLASRTQKIHTKIDPALGEIRFGILTDPEFKALNLKLVAETKFQLAQAAFIAAAEATDKADSEAKGTSKTSENPRVIAAKNALDAAEVERNLERDEQITQVVFAMLQKADPALTQSVFDAIPFDAKALLRNSLAVEIPSFLPQPPKPSMNGSARTLTPKKSEQSPTNTATL